MTLISTRMRRFAAIGAFAVTAAAAPAIFAATAPQAGTEVNAGPACLAWFGNKEDGKCLSYSNGAPTNIGTPAFGYGPSGGGVYTGPLLPGTTINQGIG
ncbi:hypothetical protein MMAG44476_05896 [Mycolicibacterium mageritense DSM 44476 = CIP 104973]|uniref:Porin n=2 Tax=Mycobacteriaceae TaxID=1762 RepID=A0AAI8U1S9_MYCME|nr:hypothetical protein EB73_36185 [Mycobacterium sp. SWH-M3]BBX38229.1 hypothetical protein MMAGJ_75110 [Mycolicibacterium mageritense]BDY32873.1 hypothetical protein hbim_06845 [Mycolicibacterium mageritense]GJJ23042.1 hypothetical protein MTY414_67150 [Mycolicibacterium mageritense]CDO27037.1 hypothetical protein BN978_07600 [Mycolicibacterium mageritense DSM 44476 = CIP 104973]